MEVLEQRREQAGGEDEAEDAGQHCESFTFCSRGVC